MRQSGAEFRIDLRGIAEVVVAKVQSEIRSARGVEAGVLWPRRLYPYRATRESCVLVLRETLLQNAIEATPRAGL
jgi:hypothetical protein